MMGCTSAQLMLEPDEQFGHRYERLPPDGSRVVGLVPVEEGIDYHYYPALFGTVVVRYASFDMAVPLDTQRVVVEVLIKGAFPDACMQLHAFEQERTGNIIMATLQMRRPQSAVCASAERPYRFYVVLEGRYGAGHYTLRLNGEAIPFQVRLPRS